MREQNALRLTLLSQTCGRLTSHAHCNEVDRAPNGERNGGEEVVSFLCGWLQVVNLLCFRLERERRGRMRVVMM